MSSGIGRRLVAGVAVTAALAGGTVLGAGPASAAQLVPITVFGSADSASQVPDGNVGIGGIVDTFLFLYGFCTPGVLAMSSGSDVPDIVAENCVSNGYQPGIG
ncbi:hypothetical protein [Rhodococcus gannanensis]|uniref:Uncharacterized protein n=1 Tax=Rhodococcus gannanensis TaxID=1960308 RepID=A0ABW4NWX0_9NOCA